MAKPELGTKRLCGSCGAKFYDLSKDPIVCPKCETVFESSCRWRAAAPPKPRPRLPPAPRSGCRRRREDQGGRGRGAGDRRRRAGFARGRRRRGQRGKKVEGEAVEGEDDIEVEETEEAPFIEEQEEGDDDVTDIIGEGREDEEET